MKDYCEYEVTAISAWLEDLKNEMEDRDLKFFLGGSRYFGFNTSESDIDFFVYTSKPYLFSAMLHCDGFDMKTIDMALVSGYPETFTVFERGKIQIILFESESDYFINKDRNDKIKYDLSKNPKLCDFIHNLYSMARRTQDGKKSFSFSGTDIFKMLLGYV